MKISFMTFACPDWTLEQVVDAAVRHRYHGIEFRCDANQRHGVEAWTSASERKQIRARLEAAGVEACCLATSLQFADERVLEEAPSRVELAADLGCPGVRVFCGPVPADMAVERVVARVGDHLRQVCDVCSRFDVQLWLETHDTMSRAVLAAAAVRAAAHRLVGINYDNMHPYRKGELLPETFGALADLVRHCHFHDALNRPDQVVIRPLGQGEMPVDDVFAFLVRIGYDGYLSGEWFHDQYGPDPDTSLEAYRRDVASLLERHGLRLP